MFHDGAGHAGQAEPFAVTVAGERLDQVTVARGQLSPQLLDAFPLAEGRRAERDPREERDPGEGDDPGGTAACLPREVPQHDGKPDEQERFADGHEPADGQQQKHPGQRDRPLA